ncbi:MAG: hypothetical protein HY331_00925 [Chloroflexi bacterium]|nr:hypothetical protein [Chloroflexota bacterium]
MKLTWSQRNALAASLRGLDEALAEQLEPAIDRLIALAAEIGRLAAAGGPDQAKAALYDVGSGRGET